MLWQVVGIVTKYYQYPITVQKGTEIQLPRQFPAVTLCNKNAAKKSKVTESLATSSSGSSNGTSGSASTGGSGSSGGGSAGSTVGPSAGPSAGPPAGPPAGGAGRRRREAPPGPGGAGGPPAQPAASKYSWMTGSVVGNGTTRNLTALGPNVIPDRVGITYTFLDYYNSLTGEWKGNVGYQIDDFLIECSIGNRYCSQRDFTRFLHPLYGNCYTFNAAKNGTELMTVQQTGPLHGLTLTLFVDQSEYVGAVANSAGVSVVIHEPTKQPFPEDSGISVSPGQETYIGLKQFYTQRLATPYSDDCQLDYNEANLANNMYAKQSNYSLPSVNYSQSACMKTCIQRQVEMRCNCSSPKIPISDPTVDPLYSSAYTICLYEYNTTLSSISTNSQCMSLAEQDAFMQCRSKCKQDCDEYFYETSLSVSMWPSDSYQSDSQRQILSYNANVRRAINSLLPQERQSFMSKNFVKIIVFYDDPVMYSSVSTAGYQIIDVLSDMGGQVGLWLGLSVLTVFEIVEMFVDLFVLCFHRSLRPRRRNNKDARSGKPEMRWNGAKVESISEPIAGPPQPLRYDDPVESK